MSNLTIVRVGPELFTKVAVAGGDLHRALSARCSAKRDDDSYRVELYAALEDTELVGAMCLVEFPDVQDTAIIDYLSIADTASSDVREALLAKAREHRSVIAEAATVPTLVAYKEFALRNDIFVCSNRPFTDKELIELWQMYKKRVCRPSISV